MAVRGNPQANADKWKRNITAATPDIQAGIAAVTQAPGQAAARQVDAYRNNVAANVDKWARNVSRVSLPDWQQATTAGVQRIAQGAAAKVNKVVQFQTEFLPHLEAGQRKLAAMPRGSLAQNLARMMANAQHNAEFKRSGN